MINVFIACGAGASSTFLAMKLRSLSQSQALSLNFFPAAITSVQAKENDLVLVASHISQDVNVAALSKAGVPVILLPERVNGGFKAEEALELIVGYLNRQKN